MSGCGIRYRSKETTAYAREKVRDHSNVMRDDPRDQSNFMRDDPRDQSNFMRAMTRAINRMNYTRDQNEFSGIFLQHCSIVE